MSLGADIHPGQREIGYDAIEAQEPTHPKNRQLLEYWRARCVGGDVAPRHDINPLDMPALMGGMFVVEPVDDGTDMRYRLIGAANEQRLGMPFTGRRFSECYEPKMAADQIAIHNRVMERLKPVVLRGNFLGVDMEYARFECLYLPVRAETGLQVFGGLYDMGQTN